MRSTETMTDSLPPGMAKQMARIQKQEDRARSELLREAWRLYFASRYPAYTPTKAERAAIDKGHAEFKRGEFVTLAELHDELTAARPQCAQRELQRLPGEDQIRVEGAPRRTASRSFQRGYQTTASRRMAQAW
jgi:predicted transcriptional regulator